MNNSTNFNETWCERNSIGGHISFEPFVVCHAE